MKKIYIFGVGKGKEIVKENLVEGGVELLGYVDNEAYLYKDGIDGKKVLLPQEIEKDFDYIIVSVMRYKYIDEQLLGLGIGRDKIIHFFSFNETVIEDYWSVLQRNGWKFEAMLFEFEKKVRPYSQNLIYELGDTRNTENIVYPKILPAKEAVELICKEHKSLARFGDYEFELMQMKKRARYQQVSRELADRLKEIIRCKDENIIIAIADNYGSLDKYTQEAAEDIRAYLSPQVRHEHMDLLDLEKTYYDAYLSRPYIMHKDKDKEKARKRFDALKEIWKGRDIIIVEGNQTRMGVGNDLLDGARSVKRVIAPNENAFSKYDAILEYVKKVAKDELVLIALGATATVLAYDLARSGLWAVDIGHLDLEYEWYCSAAKERHKIPYKYVNEIYRGNQVGDLPEHLREEYEKEIVCNLA
jgi:Domain of unknown function (DUF1792).